MCLCHFSTVAAAPFLTQDQNPFSLIHGQPQPVAAILPAEGSVQWSTSLDITNTLNVQSENQENLVMDYESYLLRLSLTYGINKNWAFRLDVPMIHYGGGFLDGAVDSWHDTFGLPQGNRPQVADNQFGILYTRNSIPVISLNKTSSGPGDIQLALSRTLFNSSQTALSLWTSIDLPTGDINKLTGNDAYDFAFWLATRYRFNKEWSTDANLGVLLPGDNRLGALTVEDTVGFGHAGVTWSPYELFDLRLQLAGHTQYYSNSTLLLLNETYNLVFGGTLHVSPCSDLDIAVSEDIKVGSTPDVSFLFTWKSKLGSCHI